MKGREPLPIEAIMRRVILEAMQESSAMWWERRAAQFDAVGNERCNETSDACRNKAAYLRRYGLDIDEAEAELNDALRAA